MDEAPVFALTSFNATVFLKRSSDVTDNRVWAAEPIWVDQPGTPARAAWANGLLEAESLSSLKQRLSRTLVPPSEHQAQGSGSLPLELSAVSKVSTELSVASPYPVGLARKRKVAEEPQASLSEGVSQLSAASAATAAPPAQKRQRFDLGHANGTYCSSPPYEPQH